MDHLLWLCQVGRLTRDYKNHNFYHESKSNTYVTNVNTFKIKYGSDSQCQVFYSKDTMNVGGMSIAEYIFAEVTDMSGQYNSNA